MLPLLTRRGFRVVARDVNERDLDGVEKRFNLIHAVSRNENVVVLIRLSRSSDQHRVHITVYRELDDDLVDELESMGFRIHSESGITRLTGFFNQEYLTTCLDKALSYIMS